MRYTIFLKAKNVIMKTSWTEKLCLSAVSRDDSHLKVKIMDKRDTKLSTNHQCKEASYKQELNIKTFYYKRQNRAFMFLRRQLGISFVSLISLLRCLKERVEIEWLFSFQLKKLENVSLFLKMALSHIQ